MPRTRLSPSDPKPKSAAGDAPAIKNRGCMGCVMRGLSLCHLLIDVGLERPLPDQPPPRQCENWAPARGRIFRSNDPLDDVIVVCEGWASVAAYLPQGKRQILSFPLPGDFVSTRLLFKQSFRRTVEAITRVCYRGFNRTALREVVIARPEVLDRFASACIEENDRTSELAIDLGRRSADQRIARLILDLQDRLVERGITREQRFDFPLRQTHLADASGITAVYVNKVLGEFRREGLIEIADRSLTILDAKRLRRVAEQ